MGRFSCVGYPPMTRREWLAAGAAAIAMAGSPVRAADPVNYDALVDYGEKDVRAAYERFRRNESYTTYLDWTDALIKYGDFAKARDNFRFLDGYREKWGNHEGRIRDLRRAVTYKDHEMTFRINKELRTPPGFTTFRKRIDRAGSHPYFPLAGPQNITDVVPLFSIEVEHALKHETRTDRLGNSLLYAIPEPGEDMLVKCRWRSRPTHYRFELHRYDPGPLPEAVKRYLGPTFDRDGSPMIDPDGPRCQAAIAGVKGDTAVETLFNLTRRCWQMLKGPAEQQEFNGRNHSEAIIAQEGGTCGQFAIANVAMARAVGIPARMIRGLNVWAHTSGPSQHSIQEYFLNGLGWIVPEHQMTMWSARWGYAPRFRHENHDQSVAAGSFLDGVVGEDIQCRIAGEWLDDGESVFFDLSKSSKNEGL